MKFVINGSRGDGKDSYSLRVSFRPQPEPTPGSRIAPAGRAHRAVNPAQLWNGKSRFVARGAGSGYEDTINMDIHIDID